MFEQIGGTYAKPVILPPEVAIGALGKIQVGSRLFQETGIRQSFSVQHKYSSDVFILCLFDYKHSEATQLKHH